MTEKPTEHKPTEHVEHVEHDSIQREHIEYDRTEHESPDSSKWTTAFRTASLTATFTLLLGFGASYFTLRDTVKDIQIRQHQILEQLAPGNRFSLDDGIGVLVAAQLGIEAEEKNDPALRRDSLRRFNEILSELRRRKNRREGNLPNDPDKPDSSIGRGFVNLPKTYDAYMDAIHGSTADATN